MLCSLAGLALQFVLVTCRYGGNWTALFCTGSKFQTPPSLAGERIYIFPNSTGYDGQMYHYVAHDPLIRTKNWRYMDSARVRYGRILLPAAAFVLAAGRQPWIDAAYIAVNLLFLFSGAWWLCRYLDSLGIPCYLATLFLLAPAALISLERLTVDLAFTALCVGFALYVRLGQDAKAYVILALACLTRDTGFALAAAACLALLTERRLVKAGIWATAMLPGMAWSWWVASRTPDDTHYKAAQLIPLRGIFETLLHPMAYPFGGAVNAELGWLDRLAILGFLLAAVLTVWLIRRNGFGQIEAAMAVWSVIGLCLPRNFWEDCYSGTRVFTPLLIYVLLRALPAAGWRATVPLLMATSRVVVQVAAAVLLALKAARA